MRITSVETIPVQVPIKPRFAIGSNLELGVGSAAMLHLGLGHRGVTPDAYPCDIIGPFFYEEDILKEPLSLGGGRAVASDRPGFGVELDEAKVEKYCIR